MKNEELHLKYLSILKNIYIEGYEWLRLDKLLYSETWYAITKSREDIHAIADKWITAKSYTVEYNLRAESSVLMLSYYRGRKDRDLYWGKISDALKDCTNEVVALPVNPQNTQPIDLAQIEENRERLKYFVDLLGDIECALHRNYLAAYLVFQFNYFKEVEPIIRKAKTAICYFDGGMFENIAIQYANHISIRTISMQHGQPIFRSRTKDMINQAQILNFNSQYFIAYNEFTKREFVRSGVDPGKIRVMGAYKTCKRRDLREYDLKVFGVFLNCPSLPFAVDSNKKLLKLTEEFCKQTDFRYILKPHPSDKKDYSNYLDLHCISIADPKETIEDISKQIYFGICNASSVFLDLYSLYVRPFIWQYDAEEYLISEYSDDYFSDVQELVARSSSWLEMSVDEKSALLSDRIENLMHPDSIDIMLHEFLKS